MQDNTQSYLAIEFLPEGGYVVSTPGHEGYMRMQHFATENIDNAVYFIKHKMKKEDK